MVQFLHRQVAFPHVFVCCLLFILQQTPCQLYAQEPLQLQQVDVRVEKYKISEIGKKLQVLDSGLLQQYRFSALSDLLAGNSQVFIKSYGLGASASSGIRGGSANQSALMWKGINIQNAMLGQADLSLVPAFLFNNIKIEYGGSSALWGSGAVAGSIHLDNELEWNSGAQSNLLLGGGSYGLNQQGFAQTFSGKKIQSVSKLYHINSVNNYLFQNAEGITQKLNHANYNMAGFLQDFKWKINERQMLTFNYWMNNNQRKLPSFKSMPSLAMQYDKANRAALDWSYFKKNYSANVKFAYLQDVLNYNDSIAAVFSKNRVNTFVAEAQNYYHYSIHTFQCGFNYTGYFAQTNNYHNKQSIEKVGLLLGDNIMLFNSRLKLNTALRAETFNTGAKPITGNLSVDYKLFEALRLQMNSAKIYRQPSLNELYWWPGGDVNLKAEEGYTFEGNVKYASQKKAWYFESNLSAFSRLIDNWILWTPGAGGIAHATNVQQVWSRGTETSWKIHYRYKQLKMGMQLNSAYILSTVERTSQSQSDVIGKQLIYSPRYQINGVFFLQFRQLSAYYIHQYVGYRFISSDNAQWLNPYHVANLKLSVAIQKKRNNAQVFLGCNNLFNQNYAVMAMRPMPYRNYEIGMNLILNSNKKHEKNNDDNNPRLDNHQL